MLYNEKKHTMQYAEPTLNDFMTFRLYAKGKCYISTRDPKKFLRFVTERGGMTENLTSRVTEFFRRGLYQDGVNAMLYDGDLLVECEYDYDSFQIASRIHSAKCEEKLLIFVTELGDDARKTHLITNPFVDEAVRHLMTKYDSLKEVEEVFRHILPLIAHPSPKSGKELS